MPIAAGEANQFRPPVRGYDDITWAAGETSKEVTVVDSGVTADSIIKPFIRVADGLDADELEMDPILVQPGIITPGVSFTVICVPANNDSNPEGAYRVLYERW